MKMPLLWCFWMCRIITYIKPKTLKETIVVVKIDDKDFVGTINGLTFKREAVNRGIYFGYRRIEVCGKIIGTVDLFGPINMYNVISWFQSETEQEQLAFISTRPGCYLPQWYEKDEK